MIGESLHIALRALGANKLRTALTMLGIIIGVGAVITLLAMGQGASAAVASRFAALGTNVIYVVPGQQSVGGVRSASGSAPTLTYDDAAAIAASDAIPAVTAVAPEAAVRGQVIAQDLNTNTRVNGTTPSYEDVLNFYPASGDFFTADQVQARAPVVVLGAVTAAELFGTADPIGQTIRVNAGGQSVSLRVIGVMQAKGGTGFANKDDELFIPITTLLAKLASARTAAGRLQINQIDVKATSADAIPTAIDQVTQVLLSRGHARTDFQTRNVQDQIDAQKQASQTLTILLGAIAGISLVVGGIGIMNIMIVSVTERTREIGIRKAVGAKQRDILLQFLMEALVVSIAGGLLGIAVGVGTSMVVNGQSLNGQPIQTVIALAPVVLAFGVSALIGLFFGIYPASRAARLNPIEALRYE